MYKYVPTPEYPVKITARELKPGETCYTKRLEWCIRSNRPISQMVETFDLNGTGITWLNPNEKVYVKEER